MSLKKILGWAVVITVAYYTFTKPTATVAAMHGVLHLLTRAGSSLAAFLSHP